MARFPTQVPARSVVLSCVLGCLCSRCYIAEQNTYTIYRSSEERRPQLYYCESFKVADLVVSNSVKNRPPTKHFTGSERLLPYSQEPATCPYPEAV